MGTFKKGILGGFSGTVGTVVGGNWKGIDYMRSRPISKRSGSSTAQDVQRLKFSLAAKFLRSMKPLLMTSFQETGGKMTGANSALSYTLKNAITGIYPDLEIDYKMALVARGSLPNVVSPQAGANAAAINFSWAPNEGIGIAAATDKAILVAYHPGSNTGFYAVSMFTRKEGSATFNLPALAGEEVETWIAFISENGKEVSSSLYTGKVKL